MVCCCSGRWDAGRAVGGVEERGSCGFQRERRGGDPRCVREPEERSGSFRARCRSAGLRRSVVIFVFVFVVCGLILESGSCGAESAAGMQGGSVAPAQLLPADEVKGEACDQLGRNSCSGASKDSVGAAGAEPREG